MMHPEMLRALADAHVQELRRGGTVRPGKRTQPMRRRARAALGWMLVDIGVRLATRHQPYRAATIR
jgi:hypothetical protein